MIHYLKIFELVNVWGGIHTIKKYRANMKCKLFVLCFLSLFIVSQLASPTTATFKDTEQIHFHLQMEDNFNDQQREEHDDTEENTESKKSDDTEE